MRVQFFGPPCTGRHTIETVVIREKVHAAMLLLITSLEVDALSDCFHNETQQ